MNKLMMTGLAGAALLSASAAMAYQPASMTDGDIVITHGGATASEQALFNSVRNLCVQDAIVGNGDDASCFVSSGTIVDADNCLNTGNLVTGGYWTVACEINATTVPGLGGTRRMLWSKTGGGGSAWGVQPVAAAGTANEIDEGFMDASQSSANCANLKNFEDCNFTKEEGSAAVGDVYLAPPNVGSSDVEPVVFGAPLNTPSSNDFDLDGSDDPLPNTNIAVLQASGAGDLPFSTVVNVVMYQGLQTLQFPTGHPDNATCNPAGASYGDINVVGSNANSDKCMPSLTYQEISSMMMNGRTVNDISDLTAESPYNSGTQVAALTLLPAALKGTGGSLTDDRIQVCRRVKGSGTQAQQQITLFNYPCDRDAQDGLIDVTFPAIASALDNTVSENAGSSDLSRCLKDFNSGGDESGNNGAGRTRWAIGLQASTRNDTISRQFRYIKTNGVAPSLRNVHAGDYPQFYTQSFQYSPAVLTGEPLTVFNKVVSNNNSPTVLGTSAFQFTQGFGLAGWLATPSGSNTPTATVSTTAPINSWVRQSNSNKPNSCALPRAFKNNAVKVIVGSEPCVDCQ